METKKFHGYVQFLGSVDRLSQQTGITVKTAICIPTLNGGVYAARLLRAIAAQTLKPDAFLVIDSASDDDSVQTFSRAGAQVCSIKRQDFNHGATRQLGVETLADADIIIFLTQDALLADPRSFELLTSCFDDPEIGAAFGRQLPHSGAAHIEAHARLFNYPDKSRVSSIVDQPTMGIKTVFISNSFSAYRRADLLAVGGFPPNLILGEDTYVAAKMLLAGKKIAYCADATVHHSHDYSFAEEFRRYFDTGVLHAREPWIRERFGNAEGEGSRYVKSEILHLWRNSPLLIPSSIFRTGCKYLGFSMGLRERLIPRNLKRRLSMFRGFWVN